MMSVTNAFSNPVEVVSSNYRPFSYLEPLGSCCVKQCSVPKPQTKSTA